MKRKRNPSRRSNPDPVIVLGWAAGSAALGAVVSYLVLREIAATKIAQQCASAFAMRGMTVPSTSDQSEIRRQALAHL